MIKPYRGVHPSVHETAFVADSAQVIGDVALGQESSIWFQAVVRGDVNYIRISDRTNIQDSCVLHVTRGKHPLVIGDEVTVGHRVVLHGCTVGNNVLIGIGAIVLDGAIIEENVMIGAGSLVPPGSRVPYGTVVMGVPAKIKREIRPNEIEQIRQSARNYVEYLKTYKQQLDL